MKRICGLSSLILPIIIFTNLFLPSFCDYEEELTSEYWNKVGQKTLDDILKVQQNKNVAKNVIFFLGDGMGISTITATRIFDGQLRGERGEENFLSFEKFPNVALSKTYNVDKQVSDSAGTATAFFTGVKANYKTIGVTASVKHTECDASLIPSNQVSSIAKWAQKAGKSTGLVTTMRVTHATPAGLYAFTANRDWESSDLIPEDKRSCPDIAHQLVHGETGKHFKVILGGGWKHFLPKSKNGTRLNDSNLINEWLTNKKNENLNAKYVSTLTELEGVDVKNTDALLGLFNNDHMTYEIDKADETVKSDEPNLVDMTSKAIKMLQKNKDGYYLLVEGGKIDWAHHAGNAKRSLMETIYLNKAVEKALELTDSSDTLIVVTADHSHTMTINGYPNRGNDILGTVSNEPTEIYPKLQYTTLMYTNGPGFRYENSSEFLAVNISGQDTTDDDYHQVAAFPRKYETHGGEDVPIYATGPMSHLFRGVVEQNYIPHAISYAACLRPEVKCHNCSSNVQLNFAIFLLLLLVTVSKYLNF